jgi:hypothetical protein
MIFSTPRSGTATQPGAPRFRPRLLVLVLGAIVVLSAACSSGKNSATPVASLPPAPSTAATLPSTPGSSVPVSASSSRPTAASSSAPATPSSTPATPRPTPSGATATATAGCQAAALDVQALRGSGAAGHQYAFLQFTNKSAKTCSLTGFPGVELRRAGAPLGKPATRSNKVVATVRLAPGTSATARLVDDSTCQAERSDSVQIIPPNLTQKFVLPLSIRGCALTVDPVIAG